MTRVLIPVLVAACLVASAGPAQADLLNASGRIAVLRVHDVGTKYGPPTDQIDVEVVVTLQNQPGKAFGFQLRGDGNQQARRAMLDLLRDAFAANLPVSMDFNIQPGKNNGVVIRVWLTR
jgi:hypothetical protein